jgi:hypothetical protein
MDTQQENEMNEWENEPDFLDWEHNGFVCRVQRQIRSKALNGYVVIPAGHPLHGVEYVDQLPPVLMAMVDKTMNWPIRKRSAIQLLCMSVNDARAGDQFNVHGGVTYSGECYWLPKDADKGFCYGFHCSRCDDLAPGYSFLSGGTYRNLEYVKAECESLADQLAEAASLVSATSPSK